MQNMERCYRRLLFLLWRASLILIFACGCQNHEDPSEKRESPKGPYSQKERKILEDFFHALIYKNGFGYVLLGSKPSSFVVYEKILPKGNNWFDALCSLLPKNRIIKEGWETWKKYGCVQSSFPLWEEPTSFSPNSFRIVIANPQRLKEIIEQCQDDFREVLKTKITEEDLLQHIPLFRDALRNHEALMGLLLGYGRRNSWLFYEKNCLKKKNIVINSWKDPHPYLRLPAFKADLDHPETIHLRKVYEVDRVRILNYYEGKDFLEATIALLQ
jgi:hypothetical protein